MLLSQFSPHDFPSSLTCWPLQVYLGLLFWPTFTRTGRLDQHIIPSETLRTAYGHLREFILFHTTIPPSLGPSPSQADIQARVEHLTRKLHEATQHMLDYSTTVEQVWNSLTHSYVCFNKGKEHEEHYVMAVGVSSEMTLQCKANPHSKGG